MPAMTILMPIPVEQNDVSIERSVIEPEGKLVTLTTTDPDRIPDAVWAEADALLLWGAMPIGEPVLRRTPRCKVVVAASVGYDQVDVAACTRRGIPVCNVPDYGTTEIADHAIAMVLALKRGIVSFQDGLRADPVKNWLFDAAPLIGRVRGRRFGIVGLGRIGTATALRAKALDCEVAFYDPYNVPGVELALGLTRVPTLEALLESSDVVSLHVPSTAETRGMMNRAAFAHMRRGAILVNTARGMVVDIDALHDALKEGRLGGAGLDVLPTEPPPAHPLLAAWRAREPWIDGRLLITPHAAFFSAEGVADLRRKGAETAVAGVKGVLRNCINRADLPRDWPKGVQAS